jgi:hypothetical protein
MTGVGETQLADGGLAGFGGDGGVLVVHCEDTLPQPPLSVEIYFQLFSDTCRRVHRWWRSDTGQERKKEETREVSPFPQEGDGFRAPPVASPLRPSPSRSLGLLVR